MGKYSELESKDLKEQTQSLILELAIGDALGVPVEFKKRNTFKITDMTGFGTYNQPVGTWSDDTSLTLTLLEHLSEKLDLSNLMNKFKNYRSGYLRLYNKFGEWKNSSPEFQFLYTKRGVHFKNGQVIEI